MIVKDVDENGEALLKGQSRDKKHSDLRVRVPEYLKYYTRKLANDLRVSESEVVRLALERIIEKHYDPDSRDTNVLRKLVNVIRRLLGRQRSIHPKTKNSHGNNRKEGTNLQ
jgi:hypothetical protein